jgi:histidyl-tRNA synthetase
MRKLSTIVAVMGASLLVACAGGNSMSADEKSFNATYEAADAARKQAASMSYEWRDTGKMLKKAREAADKGDYASANKLAMKAQMQGKMAVAQAKEQEQAWMDAVVK